MHWTVGHASVYTIALVQQDDELTCTMIENFYNIKGVQSNIIMANIQFAQFFHTQHIKHGMYNNMFCTAAVCLFISCSVQHLPNSLLLLHNNCLYQNPKDLSSLSTSLTILLPAKDVHIAVSVFTALNIMFYLDAHGV